LSAGVVVRAARAEDVAGILAIERSITTAPHWAEARYLAMVMESQRIVWIAEAAGGVVGFVVAAMVLDEVEIESIVVESARQRKGIGRALVESVSAWAKAKGATGLLLELRESNAAARRLYASMGFGAVGRRPKYYAAPVESAVLMRLTIA
jgi:ribosomal-protein-alanine N-acetyltransferase